MTFLDLLKSADAAATPGPWSSVPCDQGGDILRRGPRDESKVDRSLHHPQSHLQVVPGADARIAVLLRNAAPEIAALVEAADRVSRYFDPVDGGQGDLDGDGKRLLSALVALDAKVPS